MKHKRSCADVQFPGTFMDSLYVEVQQLYCEPNWLPETYSDLILFVLKIQQGNEDVSGSGAVSRNGTKSPKMSGRPSSCYVFPSRRRPSSSSPQSLSSPSGSAIIPSSKRTSSPTVLPGVPVMWVSYSRQDLLVSSQCPFSLCSFHFLFWSPETDKSQMSKL